MGAKLYSRKETRIKDEEVSTKYFEPTTFQINCSIKCPKCELENKFNEKTQLDYVLFSCKCKSQPIIIPIDNINIQLKKEQCCLLDNNSSNNYCVECNRIICSKCEEAFHSKLFSTIHNLIIININ